MNVNSPGYGNQIAVSIPTRWFTFVSSGYYGADLRFFFGGVTLSNYNQPGRAERSDVGLLRGPFFDCDIRHQLGG